MDTRKVFDGQAESTTPDEIEGAYEIATIHNGFRATFYGLIRIIR